MRPPALPLVRDTGKLAVLGIDLEDPEPEFHWLMTLHENRVTISMETRPPWHIRLLQRYLLGIHWYSIEELRKAPK